MNVWVLTDCVANVGSKGFGIIREVILLFAVLSVIFSAGELLRRKRGSSLPLLRLLYELILQPRMSMKAMKMKIES